MRHRRLASTAAAVVMAATAAGCGEAQDAPPLAVADSFRGHLHDGEGAPACALLSATTRAELEATSGKPCESAILEEHLPAAGGGDDVARFGSMARVRYADDVLFLARFPDGWRVMAAGCVPASDDVYDCFVKGR